MRGPMLCVLGLVLTTPATAGRYALPPGEVSMVGRVQQYAAVESDTLADIARLYGLGRNEIIAANPGVDPWLPGEGTQVQLPTRYILPDAPRRGIVVNLPEMRLYHFGRDARDRAVVTTHPVSVGRMDWRTPLGQSRVIARAEDPAWYPPESIRAEHAADGDPLPKVVPPGPDNPLGRHMLRLDIPGYLIHGTNRPYGVGMRVTHGCLRLYPEDIAWLYSEVENGEPVTLVNEPVKLAVFAGQVFVESHPPLEENPVDPADQVLGVVALVDQGWGSELALSLDTEALRDIIERASGLPERVPRTH